jgi:hypothetical protein
MPPWQLVEHSPGPVQAAAFAAARRLAASDGATDIAIASAATAPTSTNFVINFVIVTSSPVD